MANRRRRKVLHEGECELTGDILIRNLSTVVEDEESDEDTLLYLFETDLECLRGYGFKSVELVKASTLEIEAKVGRLFLDAREEGLITLMPKTFDDFLRIEKFNAEVGFLSDTLREDAEIETSKEEIS